jgi:A/G-specific adenine glycosylase
MAPVLEAWYDHHRRDLPWRKTRDPYRIYLSEIILQQTRVVQGLPYYLRFVEAYPAVTDLARADELELFRHWQGLGYYARARNLHQTARHVANTLGGQFPGTYRELLQLKGIGTYTAAAIASFAFGERVAVVDGNVYRVLARLFGITEDITTTGAKKTFAALAQQLIDHAHDPATYNQAVMEFGAIQCTPVAPDCLLCPLQPRCVGFQTGRQVQLPVKAKKAAVRERFFTYLVFERNNGSTAQVALRERTAKDIWQNLYEFALLETDEPVTNLQALPLPDTLIRLVATGVPMALPEPAVQLLSHQRIRAVFWRVALPDGFSGALPDGLAWYDLPAVERLPKPVLITNYLGQQFG